MSNALTDVETRVSSIIAELRSKADELEQQHLPVIHDAAEILERFSQDRITAELMQLGKDVLPGSTVDAIVTIIQDAGTAAAKLAAATAPPPAEPEPPAEPQA